MSHTPQSATAAFSFRPFAWLQKLWGWRRNDPVTAKSIGFAGLLLLGATALGTALSPRVPVIGLVAATHAVERPGEFGFSNRFEFRFIRFVSRGTPAQPLDVYYRYRWGTATRDDVEGGPDLDRVQKVTFPPPTPEDRERGWQSVTVTLGVVPDNVLEFRETFTVALEPASNGAYKLVREEGVLVPGLNRRWAVPSAECTIYEGCVLHCLPGDRPAALETTSVHASDLQQSVADCYLIAALIAAARRDAAQLRDLIRATSEGYLVTFPGEAPVHVPKEIDRGPDMVDLSAADVDSQGRVEIWPAIIEQAYALLQAELTSVPADQSFYAVAGGDAAEAYQFLTARATTFLCPKGAAARANFPRRAGTDRARVILRIREALAAGQSVMMSTGDNPPPEWLGCHVYVVKSVGESGITLINPLDGRDITSPFGAWFEDDIQRVIFCR